MKLRSNIHVATLLVLHVPTHSVHLTYGYYTAAIRLRQMIRYIPSPHLASPPSSVWASTSC